MSSQLPVTASDRTVLIVEDEEPLRTVYSLILTKAGYSVLQASNGQEGVDQVTSSRPDFVLLDLMMPVMNGIEFMKTLNLTTYPDMKVVVFSNNSDSGVKEEALKLGAARVVLKSDVSPSGLVDLVGASISA